MASSPTKNSTLSDAQRAKMERNRQKALLLRQSRLLTRPYPEQKPAKKLAPLPDGAVRLPGRIIDTGAGFLIDEEEEQEKEQKRVVKEPGPLLEGELLRCLECGESFQDSSLYKQFEYSVCDGCRDNEEKHVLITKTEAKDRYLLKDADFDRREPPLKFLVRKNPHNPRWGDMKLYLKLQVEKRALEVWGSMEKIDEEQEIRAENREKAKIKKFNKNVKELRKAVRSSLWTKDISAHQHTYGPESYDEDKDMYSKTCTECGQTLSYEKL